MPYGHISISGTSAAGNLSMSTHHCCLGGPGVTVQIDESLFRHKPKYHRGRPAAKEVWVFGMLDTRQSPALVVMMTVPDRSAQTLLPSICGMALLCTVINGEHTTECSSCHQWHSMELSTIH